MKLGTLDIEKAYFGTNELSRIYYGTTLVYDGSSTQPAGIDEHTLACYHFEEPVGSEASTKCFDSARNLSFALCNDVTSVVSDTYAKFGDRSLNCQAQPGCFSFGLSTTHDWTVDNWVRTDTSGFYHGTGQYYATYAGPIYFHGVFFDITNNAVQVINTNNAGQHIVLSTTSYTFPSSTWVHLATSRDITNGKTYVFVDGEKVVETNDTVENRGNGFVVAGSSSCWIDELRFSDNVRYTDDFNVPTQAYTREDTFKDNFLAIGTVNISNRVASGFSNEKYLTTGNVFRNVTQSFELHTAINLNELRTDNMNYGIIDSGLPIWGRETSFTDKNVRLTVLNNKLNLRVSTTNGRDYQISFQSTNDLQLNTKLYIKVTYDSTNGYALYTSSDDSTWNLEGSSANTTEVPYTESFGNLAIGVNSDMSVNLPLLGEIYLDNTYIKIDGEVVWKTYTDSDITPIYNVGTPDFVMKFDGNFDYYSNGNITASLVNTPKLTTGGPWDNGALDSTYNAADTSVKKAVRLNVNKSVWQNQNFFIEFFVKLQNLDQSIYQTFLGNMEHPDSTYNGWAYRWGVSYSAMDAICACYSSLQHSISELPSSSADRTVWQQKTSTANWAHYGIFVCCEERSLNYGTAWILGNGVLHKLNTTWYNFFVQGGLNDILIGNAKYGTGYTLSPIAEVRILTGENAENYFDEIQGGFYPNSERLIEYNTPTGSFSTTGLTKYTAQPES